MLCKCDCFYHCISQLFIANMLKNMIFSPRFILYQDISPKTSIEYSHCKTNSASRLVLGLNVCIASLDFLDIYSFYLQITIIFSHLQYYISHLFVIIYNFAQNNSEPRLLCFPKLKVLFY